MSESATKSLANPLENAKATLIDLETALNKKRKVWLSIKKDNPEFEQLSDENWRDTSSRSWLHGGTNIFETNELDQWLFQKVSLSLLAQQEVQPLILSWRKRNNEKGPWVPTIQMIQDST